MDAMAQAITDWKNWLLAAGRSSGTVSAYEWDVRALARANPALAPFDYRAADLNRYQAERRLAGVGASARKRSAASFRSFFGFVCGKNHSPARKLPFPRVARSQQRVLDWEQAGAVLAACETTTAVGLRDLAIVCLAMESALRNAELCRLELSRIDLERRRLRVVIKGGQEGVGSFDPLTTSYLSAWIEARKAIALPDTKTVFCSVGGLTPGRPLTPGGLRCIFRQIGKKAGLAAFSPHDLRRSCATLKTRLGAPTRTIQVGGRWSNLREVETYTQAINLEDFESYSPVAHLMRPETRPPLDAASRRGSASPAV
jgi:integrase/recombinase XerD